MLYFPYSQIIGNLVNGITKKFETYEYVADTLLVECAQAVRPAMSPISEIYY